MQADTGQTPDKTPAGDNALEAWRKHVSSKFIRHEAARAAADAEHARTVAQRFSILRTRILREMRSRNWRRLAVVPVTDHEGGTFVAVNLALALARQQHTEVLLLDLDIAAPSVARELGIPGCDPVAETLRRGRPLDSLVSVVDEAPNLSVLAPDQAEFDAAEMLQDEMLADALNALGDQRPNAIAIMNVAHLLGEDAALATLPLADAILLVADGRHATAAHMTQAERLLNGMPPVMGVVLNNSED